MSNTKEMSEISKIEKYISMNRGGVHTFVYQIMFLLIASGLLYRYLITNLISIDPVLEKDITTMFIIVPLIIFGIFYHFKERKTQKQRDLIVFESVNVFDFISKFETDPVKKEIVYLIVTGRIFENIHRFKKMKNTDVERFKEEVKALNIEYNSMEVYKYLKNIRVDH